MWAPEPGAPPRVAAVGGVEAPLDGPAVAIVGGGPAGLMAAEAAATGGAAVTVYDRMPSFGRKFLLAGRGGLNLTHSEDLAAFLNRYGAANSRMRPALMGFPPGALRQWCEGLGQATFVGSSGRVFPVSFKTSPLLRAWLGRLNGLGVRFCPAHRWTGWDPDGALAFVTPTGAVRQQATATVLALGGASWPRLGSDGTWTTVLEGAGIRSTPLRPSNCGFTTAWSAPFRDRFEGQPLKNVALTSGGHTVRGDLTVTRTGLEGGATYPLSPVLRDAILAAGHADLSVALRPDLAAEVLERKLGARTTKQSIATHLRKSLHLAPVAIGLLQEAAHASSQPLGGMDARQLARLVNAVPVRLDGAAPIAGAISTAGGIAWDALTETLMLRERPGTFAAGEMLDWEAPTGGYLLQGAFATGLAAGRAALDWTRERAIAVDANATGTAPSRATPHSQG